MALLKNAYEIMRSKYNFPNFDCCVIGSYMNGLALNYESNIDFVLSIGKEGVQTNHLLLLLSESITTLFSSLKTKPTMEYTYEI
jgi:hypothetical protein